MEVVTGKIRVPSKKSRLISKYHRIPILLLYGLLVNKVDCSTLNPLRVDRLFFSPITHVLHYLCQCLSSTYFPIRACLASLSSFPCPRRPRQRSHITPTSASSKPPPLIAQRNSFLTDSPSLLTTPLQIKPLSGLSP